jgi:hypothetical protein
MFDITTSRDFYAKLVADFDDFMAEPDSGRLALNCAITAYHLYEWVWGDWLKTDYVTQKVLGVRDRDSFAAWKPVSYERLSKMSRTKSSPRLA